MPRRDESPFHAGEIMLQRRAGVHERLAEIGERVIRDHMPEQHRELFRKLTTLIVGSVDAARRPWASILVGAPGFIHDLDAYRLRVEALPGHGESLAEHLALGASIALLGLEPQTRRRNRMNGRVTSLDARGFEVRVEQSFGNCPQYIQARTPTWVSDRARGVRPRPIAQGGAHLSDTAKALIRAADTFFIASAAAPSDPAKTPRNGGVDVSHRGGRPGFVRVDDTPNGSVLTVPDFRGNFFFNTLGNIVAHPYAGLLFIDYEHGGLLQIAGRALVIEGGDEVRQFEGAQRLLRIAVERSVWSQEALPLRWSAPEPAPQLASTGVWAETATAGT
ncbi:MAG TPA: pyridoxamine 5'-phosphate oxidase family protein [Burkholderiaceae bacterium]|nr:pyridoxamine 5'-phosphate oxidase family protein [Burkholderiaceae bacterium]